MEKLESWPFNYTWFWMSVLSNWTLWRTCLCRNLYKCLEYFELASRCSSSDYSSIRLAALWKHAWRFPDKIFEKMCGNKWRFTCRNSSYWNAFWRRKDSFLDEEYWMYFWFWKTKKNCQHLKSRMINRIILKININDEIRWSFKNIKIWDIISDRKSFLFVNGIFWQ